MSSTKISDKIQEDKQNEGKIKSLVGDFLFPYGTLPTEEQLKKNGLDGAALRKQYIAFMEAQGANMKLNEGFTRWSFREYIQWKSEIVGESVKFIQYQGKMVELRLRIKMKGKDFSGMESGENLEKDLYKQKRGGLKKPREQIIEKCCQVNSLVYRLKNYLNKEKISLKQQCMNIIPDQQQTINQIEFQRIIQKCGLIIDREEICKLYSDVTDSQTNLLQFQTLQEILNRVIMFKENQQILDIFLKRENIPKIIASIGRNVISTTSLTKILKEFNYKDEWKGQNWINSILKDNLWISDDQFFDRISQEAQTRNFYQKQKDIWRFKQYFNEESTFNTSRSDQQEVNPLFTTSVQHLKIQLPYVEKKDQKCWGQQLKSINYAKAKAKYSLFTKSEEDLSKKRHILRKCLSSNDVASEQIKDLNDFQLLSSIACLADKNPQSLYRLFVLIKNPSHLYAVKLFNQRYQWDTLDVDLQFPLTTNGKHYGAKPNNGIIWPLVLEKAIAKLRGGYKKLASLNYEDSLKILTGLSSELVQTSGEGVLADIKKELNSSIVTCEGDASNKNGRYLYSVQDISTNGKETLIKMRNSLRDKILRGKQREGAMWKDESGKKRNYAACSNDGIFYMLEKDFLQSFPSVNIRRIKLTSESQYLDVKEQNSRKITLFKQQLSDIASYK